MTEQEYKDYYWNYYLELEEQLLETKRYAEFSKKGEVYSIEYLKLFQAICSEIDVLGKELAMVVSPGFTIDNNTNIKKWGFAIQQKYSSLKDETVIFYSRVIKQPFMNWEYEQIETVGGKGATRLILRLKGNAKTPKWWNDYNHVKHQRVGLLAKQNNYHLANQKNSVDSLCALFLLETLMMNELNCVDCSKQSRLFKLNNG